MAERNNKLILPDFFGSKGGLSDPNSIVNTTSPLEPGETIFEKDTGQFKTNLSASALPYSQSGYAGNAIRFDSLTELRTYDTPPDYQLVHTINPKSFFYYDPTDTTSTDNGTTVIVSNGGKRYKIFNNSKVTSTVTQGTFSGTVVDAPVSIVAVKDDTTKGTTSFYFKLEDKYYWIAQVENP